MGCQGRFVPSEHPKTRVMEIEKEKKEASVASNASWLTGTESAKPIMAKVVETMS